MASEMAFFAGLRRRARQLKAETLALYLAARDPRTPWYAKLLAAAVAAYAFSPVDLIPDFVPLLGHLDDLILVPAGIALVIKLIPRSVMAECRAKASARLAGGQPVSLAAGVTIVIVWLALAAVCLLWVLETSGVLR